MTTKNQTLTLSQAAEYDHQHKVKDQISGWGQICKEREGKPFTRKARVKANKDARIKSVPEGD